MKNSGVHTVPAKGARKGWTNVTGSRVLSRHRTKAAAVAAGRVFAQELAVEHTIHRRDGVIKAKNSYGNDAYPPKG